MTGVIAYFILLVEVWNWFCNLLEDMSGGSFCGWYYMITITELELLSESSIIVWLCQQYTSSAILICLELLGSLGVVTIVGIAVGSSWLCTRAVRRFVGLIGDKTLAISRERDRAIKDIPSEGQEDRSFREGTSLQIEGEAVIGPAAIEWEDLQTVGICPSRRLTREDDMIPTSERRSRSALWVRRSTRLGKRRSGMESRQTSRG